MTRWIPLIWTPDGWAFAFQPYNAAEPSKRASFDTREEAIAIAQRAAQMSGSGLYDAAEVRMPPRPASASIPFDAVPMDEL